MGRSELLRTMAGFLFGPISPALLVIAIVSITTVVSGKMSDVFSARQVGEAWWIIKMAALVGYPVALVLGVPIHLLFRWLRWDGVLFYAGAGVGLGVMVWLVFVSKSLFTLAWLVLPILCSVVASVCFWLIVRPDKYGDKSWGMQGRKL